MPSSGLTSCATSSTVTCCSRQIRSSSAATARWLGRSRLSSGSSRISSRGRLTSACAISSRCCSPPESVPIGRARVGARADQLESPRSTRSPPARRSGSPQRAPSSPSLHEVDAADPGCRRRSGGAAAGSRSARFRAPGRAPEHRRLAPRERQLSEQHPQQRRLARPVRSEDRRELPRGDLDVDIAPHHVAADPRLRAARARTAGAACACGARARGRRRRRRCSAPCSGSSSARAHLPVAWWSAASRLRSWASCHCSNVAEAGESVSVIVVIGMWAARASWLTRWTSGRRVLAVVDPHLDRVAFDLAVDRLLVRRAHVGSLGDRLGEAVGRQQRRGRGLRRAAGRCSRCSPPGRPRSASGSARAAGRIRRARLVSNARAAPGRSSRRPRGRAARSRPTIASITRRTLAGEYHWCGLSPCPQPEQRARRRGPPARSRGSRRAACSPTRHSRSR